MSTSPKNYSPPDTSKTLISLPKDMPQPLSTIPNHQFSQNPKAPLDSDPPQVFVFQSKGLPIPVHKVGPLDYEPLPTRSVDVSQMSDASPVKRHSIPSPSTRAPEEDKESPEDDDQEENKEEDIFEEKKEKQLKPWKRRVQRFLNNTFFNIFTAFAIFYTLFQSDFKQLATGADADFTFDIISIICMSGFAIEICCNMLVTPNYIGSFFFFLDIISTVSLILDINLIAAGILPSSASRSAAIARASRVSRIGTKAGRIVRIVRLARLSKMYKQIAKDKTKIDSAKIHPDSLTSSTTNSLNEVSSPDGVVRRRIKTRRKKIVDDNSAHNPFSDELSIKESRIGKKLSEMTTKRLIVLILLLLIIVPLCTSDFYFDDPDALDYEVNLLGYLYNDTNISTSLVDAHRDFIRDHLKSKTPGLIALEVTNLGYSWKTPDVDVSAYRDADKSQVYSDLGYVTGTSNLKSYNDIQAGLGIGKTIFIGICLVVGSLFFSKDANDLLLRHLERMILKVKRIAKNPLEAKDQRLVAEDGSTNETVVIENSIIKIGCLLTLGFGEAGTQILHQNIIGEGDINPMLPGRKILSIYGFCDIRNFTDATEVLQEEVLLFVNSIGGIVHSVVDSFCGCANKNIGDAFLLTWKIPESELIDPKDVTKGYKHSKTMASYADYSLMSFLKIIAKTNRNSHILSYRKHVKLNERIENYRVRMGFGLHIGWAIEGAIGSYFKIDASYLSPNVNMASRLEAATKQYGVPLLFSGDLFEVLSPESQERSRLIDVVTVKGSVNPVKLYTVDVYTEEFPPQKDRSELTQHEKHLRQKAKKINKQEMMQDGESATLWDTDMELLHLTRHHNPDFTLTFEQGFKAYVDGDWKESHKKFTEALKIKESDGPTTTLMNFIEENRISAPDDWNGYRVLTDK